MQSIGYLEVEGLPGAIVAADRMLKTADVSLKYVENTKGGGWITVSVTGDVAAVQAAIDAGIGELGDQVYCSDVIANPAPGIETLGKNDAIKGNHLDDQGPDDPQGPSDPKGPDDPKGPNDGPAPKDTPKPKDDSLAASPVEESTNTIDQAGGANAAPLAISKGNTPDAKQKEAPVSDKSATSKTTDKNDTKEVTCNLCGDPACPRKMGEPHKKCIHYAELKGTKK